MNLVRVPELFPSSSPNYFPVTFLASFSFYTQMGETDESLMLAVRNGDVSKLGVLFDRHHRALFDFFYRMTGLRTVADDLVQDVFFRILKYRKTFRDESSFKAWMFHIARNTRFDYYRSHRDEAILEDEHADGFPGSSPLPGQRFRALGAHTALPSWCWRLIYLVLFMTAGIGIIPYIIMWICLPEDPRS